MKTPAEKERIARAVREFQQGIDCEGNFRRIFDAYYHQVQGFFAKRVSLPEDCLDLTQDTFLRVYKGLEGYRGEAELGTWLFRIAFNTHLKWLRRQQAAQPTKDGLPPPEGPDFEPAVWEEDEPVAVSPQPSPLDDALAEEQHRLLREAIDQLPGQMRKCTELRIYQELSYREIAVLMRLSIETVKVHLFQARKKLKEVMRDSSQELNL
jgi:RNA polymerase sigma-70 factor (ECF subfamily)